MDIPPSKLNRLPQGLLSFFDIKAMGQYPTLLSEQVSGVMDLTRWYADANAIEVLFSMANITIDTGGTSLQITATTPINLCDLVTAGRLQVPQNELWLILEAEVIWAMGAGTGTFDAAIRSGENNTIGPKMWPMDLVGFQSALATIPRNGTRVLTRPYFVLPGDQVQAFLFGATMGGAAAHTWSGRLRLLRLQR